MNVVFEMIFFFFFIDSVVMKVKEFIEEEGNLILKLCVFVIGGGCFGFQYGFMFDEEVNEDDISLEKNGVMFFIDLMSY